MKPLCCIPKRLPFEIWHAAALTAIAENPFNHPGDRYEPAHLALVVGKRWANGTVLTVGFMDNPAADLRARILSHMNAWSEFCGISFAWTQTSPLIRISRGGGGYYSFLGTDCKHIPANQQTMNLEGFTMQTPESEYHRVVRHETGHAMGFPHEHQRREIVAKLDRAKVIAWGQQTQGWSPAESIAQMLTPIDEASILGTPRADPASIMAYHFDGNLTIDGQPIIGGSDIDTVDRDFATSVYPKAVTPPPPPPPPPTGGKYRYVVSSDSPIGFSPQAAAAAAESRFPMAPMNSDLHALACALEAPSHPLIAAAVRDAANAGVSFTSVFAILTKYAGGLIAHTADVQRIVNEIRDLIGAISSGN